MNIKITNVYNDIAPRRTSFKADHGQGFYIQTKVKNILFDTGSNGKILLHNLKLLDINPNDIDTIILSHGHFDHTGGLSKLIKARTNEKKVQIVAHPKIQNPKRQKTRKGKLVDIGFPKIPAKIKNKIDFILTAKPFEIIPDVAFTTGEISNRTFKDGISDYHLMKENDEWIQDKMEDDLSLIIKTTEGVILICGCCHAGLINTLEKVKKITPGHDIHAIIGGTHMYQFTGKEVALVARQLRSTFNSPKLYFNHCSGLNTIDQLLEIFSKETVQDCLIGKSFNFST